MLAWPPCPSCCIKTATERSKWFHLRMRWSLRQKQNILRPQHSPFSCGWKQRGLAEESGWGLGGVGNAGQELTENGGYQWEMADAILQAGGGGNDLPQLTPFAPSRWLLPCPHGAVPSVASQLFSLLLQIAAMRVASPTRSVIPGAGPTRRAATCWNACAWATGRASGPASPWVGGDSFPGSVRAHGRVLIFSEVIRVGWPRADAHPLPSFPQLNGATTTRPGRPTWSARPGRSRTRAG